MIVLFTSIILHLVVHFCASTKCELPSGCHIKLWDRLEHWSGNRILTTTNLESILCAVETSEHHFDLKSWLNIDESKRCSSKSFYDMIELRFSKKQNIILGPQFGLQSVIDFMLINYKEIFLRLTNLKGFELDLGVALDSNNTDYRNTIRYHLDFINTRFDFYANGRLIRSCSNMDKLNHTKSIFQVQAYKHSSPFYFINCHFKRPMCPLVFKNSRIKHVYFIGVVEYYLKQNILTFSNHSFKNLNSYILGVSFLKSENIAINSKLLHPEVYKEIESLTIFDGYREIQDDVFATFNYLKLIQIEANYWKRLVHKQGIKWMSSINSFLNINPNNREEILKNNEESMELILRIIFSKKIDEFFPEEDFCIYQDFPFHRLVFIKLFFDETNQENLGWLNSNLSRWEHKRITCTFRYITKYHEYFDSVVNNFTFTPSAHSCNFVQRLKLCEKTILSANHVWTIDDSLVLNRLFQIILVSSSYVICILGILTNLTVLLIILRKDNSDLFKQNNQYAYLCSISVYSIIILFIQLISWMSDCSALIDVFCPATRKLIPIQFFKLIFKESLVVALRFMSNFSYVAFAFNRLSLVGKDHPKLAEFISKIDYKKYILITGIISIILSIIKGFKYTINYEHSELNHPINFEYDLWFTQFSSSVSKSAYLVINFISDFLNYLAFLVFHLFIDIYMLLQLRMTLTDKSKKLIDLNSNTTGSADRKPAKKELEVNEAMNNAIKMVVWNSALNIVLKVFLLISPLLNTITIFYYQSKSYKSGKQKGYDTFINLFNRSGFSETLPILADWLYTVLISIQLFVYVRFDKKIKAGFDRLLKRDDEI